MILWDVNIWVYAFRSDSPLHAVARESLERVLSQGEPFLFIPYIASSFLRLVTSSRIFREPSDPEESWRFLDYLETSDSCRTAAIDRQAYSLFKHLCLTGHATGNQIPNALIAAAALRFDAEVITADRTFSSYVGVRVRPL